MRLCCKVDDSVDLILLHQLQDGVEVAYVSLYEDVVWLVFNILEVGQVSGISQLVDIDDAIVRIFVYEKTHYMTSYEACASCYDDVSLEIHAGYF